MLCPTFEGGRRESTPANPFYLPVPLHWENQSFLRHHPSSTKHASGIYVLVQNWVTGPSLAGRAAGKVGNRITIIGLDRPATAFLHRLKMLPFCIKVTLFQQGRSGERVFGWQLTVCATPQWQEPWSPCDLLTGLSTLWCSPRPRGVQAATQPLLLGSGVSGRSVQHRLEACSVPGAVKAVDLQLD